jgi:hypothetical protein
MTRLDPMFGRDRACPWNLVPDLPMTSLLAELVASWGVGPMLDPVSCPGQTRTMLLGLHTFCGL